MANRPIFTLDFNGFPFVETVDIEFKWYSGFAKSQMQKTIVSLHEAAEKQGIAPVLEISRKSVYSNVGNTARTENERGVRVSRE